MSETFLRVDLRDSAQGQAHDFRKVALQPGVPLLDPLNTNYRTLRKWFGDCVAQPEFRPGRPDDIGFCVCDEQERRIVSARCEPITENDLKNRSEITRQFDELKSKLQTLQPENPKEATLLNAVRGHFNNLTANPGNLGFSFFQYRNGPRRQLVWLWGFERRDSKPATAAICKRPGCRHLIARRVGETSSCPVCQGPPMPFPKSRERWGLSRLLLFLLFLLALLVGGFFAFFRNVDSLIAPAGPTYAVRTVPELEEPWKIPVGGRLKYQIFRLEGKEEEDITDRVDVMAGDPQTARIDRPTRYLRAHSVGETTVSFYLDQEEIRAIPLTVLEPTMPKTLRLDPEDVTLGIGTTRQLMLLGQYDDNRTIDLTEVALWKPSDTPVVSNVLGLLEGLEKGKAETGASYSIASYGIASYGVASYGVDETVAAMDASCRVEVLPENYTAIEIRGVPERLYEDFSSMIEVVTQNEKGEQRFLTRSPRLRFHVEPPEAAFMESGNLLTALTSGEAKLRAQYDAISDETLENSVDFEVVRDETASHFLVQPEKLELAVGETVLLDILQRGPDTVSVHCDDETVVEFVDGDRAIGRKPGKTSIILTQNNIQKEIPVEVFEADWESVAFSPDRVFVAVDHSTPLRLLGKDKTGKERELAWDQIVWEKEPDPDFAELDFFSWGVSGLKPTGETPQIVQARHGDRTTEAKIEVLPAPLRLTLSPAGPVDLPVDQQIQFTVRADYGDGEMEVDPDRVQWTVQPESLPEGVVWDPLQGVLKAEKAGLGPVEICAVYQGETTEGCQTKTCESVLVEVDIAGDKPSLAVGESGNVLITPKDTSSPTSPIPEKYTFESESNVVTVDSKTGCYTGATSGTGTVTATHPAVKGKVLMPVEVIGEDKPRLEIRPNKIELNVGETASVSLVKIDGDSEESIPLLKNGESVLTTTNTTAARIRPPDRIVGVQPAPPFQISAEYEGVEATATVEVLSKHAGGSTRHHCNDPNCTRCRGAATEALQNHYSSGSKTSPGTSRAGRTRRGSSSGRTPGRSPINRTKPGEAPKTGLVLSGPEWMEVDSEASYTVTLDDRDVTLDHSSLVIDPESEKLATAKYGCELKAKKPGTVTVRARRFTQVSNPIQVEILPKGERPDSTDSDDAPDSAVPDSMHSDSVTSTSFTSRSFSSTSTTSSSVTSDSAASEQEGDRPFQHLSLDRSTKMLDDGRFQVYVNVDAAATDKELEYRIAPLDEKDRQEWVSLETGEDGRQRARLASPPLQGDVNGRHQVMIETRNKKDGRTERHPFDFRIKKTIEVEP